jgi:hypothetical protein
MTLIYCAIYAESFNGKLYNEEMNHKSFGHLAKAAPPPLLQLIMGGIRYGLFRATGFQIQPVNC